MAELDRAARTLKPDHPLMLIANDLRALLAAPDDRLLIADQALTRFLPLQLDRLRAALAARPVTDADLPAELRADWQLPDGRVRVQALAAANAQDAEGLRRFTSGVTSIAPDAGGAAIIIAATATTILDAFRTAAIGAVIGITLLLLLVVRRIADEMRGRGKRADGESQRDEHRIFNLKREHIFRGVFQRRDKSFAPRWRSCP